MLPPVLIGMVRLAQELAELNTGLFGASQEQPQMGLLANHGDRLHKGSPRRRPPQGVADIGKFVPWVPPKNPTELVEVPCHGPARSAKDD